MQAEMAHMKDQVTAMRGAKDEAEDGATRAVAALDAVKIESDKAMLNASRHQQVWRVTQTGNPKTL